MRALLAVLLLLCLGGCAHRAPGPPTTPLTWHWVQIGENMWAREPIGWAEWEQQGGRWVRSVAGR